MIGSRGGRSVVAAVITLLAVLLPALRAGAAIDGVPRDGELARVGAAIVAVQGPSPGPDALLLALFAGDDPTPDAVQRRLPVARLAAVLAVFVCSAGLWLAVSVALGRMHALMACVAYAFAEPIAADGFVLRGELACAAFAALATLLLVLVPARVRQARRRRGVMAWSGIALHAVAAGTALGLAVASAPGFGVWVFLPGLAMLAAALGAARAFVRVLRRFRGLVLPFQAVALRIAPYVVTTLASFAAALLTLERTLATESQPAQDALLPAAPLLRGLWLALAVLGALRLGYVLAFSRRRAAQPDARALLAIAVAVPLAQRLARGGGLDAMPATAALAVLVGEGVWLLAFAAAARLSGFRRRAAA